jgi:ABC-type phosphate transport system ATPase subunit
MYISNRLFNDTFDEYRKTGTVILIGKQVYSTDQKRQSIRASHGLSVFEIEATRVGLSIFVPHKTPDEKKKTRDQS